MIALRFQFLAGRYHATAWDHHVNEGTVEWPPSPWRILRSLVSAALRAGIPVADAQPVLAALLAPPVYAVPASTGGHTRHYMPAPEVTTKVFDTFRAVDDPLDVVWPDAHLSEPQLAFLDEMLLHLAYLGRAESRVEASRLEHWTGTPNVVPCADGTANLRLSTVGSPPPEARLRTFWEVLLQDTATLHKAGWSQPPGLCWTSYRADLPRRRPPRRTAETTAPHLAWYALAAPVLPRQTETLRVAERIRSAFMGRSKDESGDALMVFSGKDEHGVPLQHHRHAFFLPLDEDGDGFLDHLVVYAHGGFSPEAVQTLQSIRSVRRAVEGEDLRLVLLGCWTEDDLPRLVRPPQQKFSGVAPSATWESRTPFFLSRHPKKKGDRWVDTPEDQLRLGLRHLTTAGVLRNASGRGLPELRSVTPVERPLTTRVQDPPWSRFRDLHRGGGSRALEEGFGFRLVFAEPVVGPIAVGYGAHFGLGLFASTAEKFSD